jgi:LPXTG-motif cell wall-anchored protein
MKKQRWRKIMSLILVFLMMLTSSVTVNAMNDYPISKEGIEPVEISGNTGNGNFSPNSNGNWHSYEGIKYRIYGNEKEYLEWKSDTHYVISISIKGGNNYHLYEYDYEYDGILNDENLVSPLNNGNQIPAISNILIEVGAIISDDEDNDDEDTDDEDTDDEDTDDEDTDDEDTDDEDTDDEDTDDEDTDDEDTDDEDTDDEDTDDEDTDDEDTDDEIETTTRRNRVAVVEVPEIELPDEDIAEALPEPMMEEVVVIEDEPIEEVFLDEPIAEALPIAILEDEELPQTGGLPLEAFSLIGVALTGIGAVLRKKNS